MFAKRDHASITAKAFGAVRQYPPDDTAPLSSLPDFSQAVLDQCTVILAVLGVARLGTFAHLAGFHAWMF
jgi:hypothetical protein